MDACIAQMQRPGSSSFSKKMKKVIKFEARKLKMRTTFGIDEFKNLLDIFQIVKHLSWSKCMIELLLI